VAEIEFEVPGPHPPCEAREWRDGRFGLCGNDERMIRHVPSNMGKMLVCGVGHNQRAGKAFIPGHEFDEGGAYHGILPPEFLPDAQSRVKSRWKIPADAVINDSDVDTCMMCRVPPRDFYAGAPIDEALPWFERYEPEIADTIRREVAQSRGTMAQWYLAIGDELRTRIRKRLDMSRLEVDHAVPRKLGNEVWTLLTPSERRVLQSTLLVKMCKRCNMSKSKKLPLRETVERWYAEVYYDGDIVAAKADQPRWDLVSRTLSKVYGERAVG
jgi:hypothetical protein